MPADGGVHPTCAEETNLALPTFLLTIEQSALSVWIRESPSMLAYPLILTAHTIGLACLVGPSVAIDLRVLGVAPGLPLAPLARFSPVTILGLWINTITGVLLLIAYPTKALTDPVFYLKLTFIALALGTALLLRKQVYGRGSASEPSIGARCKMLARFSLVWWLGAITAGKFIEYTYKYITFPKSGG